MTDDLDISVLAKSWQQQPLLEDALPNENDLKEAQVRKRKQKYLLYVDWAGASIMLAAATWLTATSSDFIGYFTAIFLTFGAVGTLWVSSFIHKPILHYDNWSSEGVLKFRQKICEFSLRYYRVAQTSCMALIIFTLVFWGMYLHSLAANGYNLLLFYSFVVSPLCLIGMVIIQSKVNVKKLELECLKEISQTFVD